MRSGTRAAERAHTGNWRPETYTTGALKYVEKSWAASVADIIMTFNSARVMAQLEARASALSRGYPVALRGVVRAGRV